MTTPLTPDEERRMREWMVAHPDAYTAKCIGMLDAARELIAEFEQVAFAHQAEMAGAEEHIAGLRIELKEEQDEYEALTQLLQRRFPPNADGSLPDFAIDDVLRENEIMRAALASRDAALREVHARPDALAECIKERERMRPVVEAASEWKEAEDFRRFILSDPANADSGSRVRLHQALRVLFDAADAYRAGRKP
jgi:hypothetical protein